MRYDKSPIYGFNSWLLNKMCTRTEWYVVPLFWSPIAAYLFLRSLFQFTGPLPNFFQNPVLPLSYLPDVPLESWTKVLPCFFLGNLIWTLLEYLLHRFLFHVDDILPDRPGFLMLHFLMHGIHHYLPMDRCAIFVFPCIVSNCSSVSGLLCRLRCSSPYSFHSPNCRMFCSQFQ